MTKVILYRAPDGVREDFETSDVLGLLRMQFGRRFPVGGRITDMASGQNVTPSTEADIQRLRGAAGPLIVEVFPLAPVVVTYVLQAIAIAAVSLIVSSLLEQDPPTATQRNVQQESPNNGLSDRTNKARVNGRIPDVYGQIRSTPDLLAAPYKVFENHVEKEVTYMCVGRGAYEIHDVRDDTTLVEEIAGSSVEVFGPNTSPNSGDAPQLRIGNAINLAVVSAKRCNGVNGQVLEPQDVGRVVRRGTIFSSPNVVQSQDPDVDFTGVFLPGDAIQIIGASQTQGTFTYQASNATFELPSLDTGTIKMAGNRTADWAIGQVVSLTNGTVSWTARTGGEADMAYTAFGNVQGVYEILGVSYDAFGDLTSVLLDVTQNAGAWIAFGDGSAQTAAVGSPILTRPSGIVLFDLSGTYIVNTVTSSQLTLNDPASVNSQWLVMRDSYGGKSVTILPTIVTTGERWVGAFTVESVKPVTRLIANVVALNGMFKDNGSQQYRTDVAFVLEVTPVDAGGNPTGAAQTWTGTVVGSATTRSTRAFTMDVALSVPSRRIKVRARRITSSDTGFNGSIVDEVQWRDLYACSAVSVPNFGNVTTVHAVTFATDGALAIKERKLNLLVTRKLPQRQPDGRFSAELYPTVNVADILSAVCLDPKIGNRSAAEVDFDNLYQTAEDIRQYFGADVAQFNYTIDKDNLSFEEIVSMIASAIFCQAYRRGSVIRLFFERETDASALLFNHRNKVPDSDHRTDQITPEDGYDGVEYQWIDPDTDASTSIYIPQDQSAVNAKVIESVGVRVRAQAQLQAWRAWNKLQFQDQTTQFTALPEANLLTLSERILCADNTRGESWDGDIVGVPNGGGLVVQMSQPFEWGAASYTMFLQNSDGQVEGIPVSNGGGRYLARLARAPRTPVIPRGEGYNTTTYIIVDGSNARKATPFLITEKGVPDDDGTIPITAINYDARYYQNDGDFRSA